MPRHARKLAKIHVEMLAEQRANHALCQRHDLALLKKRGFDINLGKLGLPIRAQVFVPETPCNLVVAIKAGHHQKLLEKLR